MRETKTKQRQRQRLDFFRLIKKKKKKKKKKDEEERRRRRGKYRQTDRQTDCTHVRIKDVGFGIRTSHSLICMYFES